MTYIRLPQINEAEGALLSGGAVDSIMYSDTNGGVATLSTYSFDETYSFMGIGTATPAAKLHISGALSSPNAFSATGTMIAVAAATITDIATASGTITTVAVNSLGIPTLAFSNAATGTNASTLYIAGAPVAGDNATLTNKYALHIAGGNIKLGVGNIELDTTTGTKIGSAASQKLGFLGATPIVQRVGAAQAAVVTTSATNSSPYGFATGAQADAIVTLVNELRAALVAFGLISGAA